MSIGANLLRFRPNQEFIDYDLETESLNGIFARPWQLGMVQFTLKENLGEQNRFIWWPDLRVTKRAAEITRFNYAEYKEKAEDPKKVLEEFEDTIYSKKFKLVNQNLLGFDAQIVNVWRRSLGLKPYVDYLYEEFKVYDTLAISRSIKKQIKPDTSSSKAFLAWQYKMLSIREKLKCSLGAIGKELGVAFDEQGLHDALIDVRLCREVFRKQIYSVELI